MLTLIVIAFGFFVITRSMVPLFVAGALIMLLGILVQAEGVINPDPNAYRITRLTNTTVDANVFKTTLTVNDEGLLFYIQQISFPLGTLLMFGSVGFSLIRVLRRGS